MLPDVYAFQCENTESDIHTDNDWEAYFHNQLLISNGSLIVYCFVAILFFTGIWSILKLNFLSQPRPMVTLCLASCMFGFSGSIIIIIYYFFFDMNCIARNAFSLVLFQLSASCTDLVLLMRAYVVNDKQTVLLYIGVVLCASKYIPFCFVLVNLESPLSSVLHVCEYVNLPFELNYVMGIDLVANFFFCLLFIIAIRRHIHLIKTELEPTLFQTDLSQRIKAYYQIVKKSVHFFIISAITMFIVILMTLLADNNITNTILPYYLGMALASRFLTNAVVAFRARESRSSVSHSTANNTEPTFDATEELSSEMTSVTIPDSNDPSCMVVETKLRDSKQQHQHL
ncbi:hypothetical protein K7432_015306 [Basidiobolus ranarum]|uniref:G-protein coupled receptors family 1 profile domain-containing protein n=1 Tax=Basidiobolus ranarum TaxID=34480 RepID=A0ABR2VNA4_9FUNG